MSNFSESFEKVKGQVKKGVDNVCSVVSEKIDFINLSSELRVEKAKLTELYAKYGKSCYEDAPDEAVKDAIDSQVTIVEELEEALAKLEESKPTVVFCTKCGVSCDSEDDYCSKCGAKLKK